MAQPPPDERLVPSGMAAMPPPRRHRPPMQPEEGGAGGLGMDVLASFGGGLMVLGIIAMVAWILYSLLR